MSKLKHRVTEVLSHREHVYDSVLDNLILGKENPEHVHMRWVKLKQIKKGKKGKQ